MNRWQVARQIQYLLRTQDWPGGSTDAFGRVVVTVFPDEEVIGQVQWPMAFVRPGSFTVDPEHSEEATLLQSRYTITVYVQVASDGWGEAVLIGGHRASATDSDGRGLLEVEEVVFDAVARLDGESGIEAQVIAASASDAQHVPDLGFVASCQYVVEALCTADRFYHPCTRFQASDATGGNASLSWKVPPDRFDRYRVILRRASGATAPTSITGGTGVTLASDLATSITDSPGAGTFSYALFGTYDEDDTYDGGTADSDDQVSASATATVVVT